MLDIYNFTEFKNILIVLSNFIVLQNRDAIQAAESQAARALHGAAARGRHPGGQRAGGPGGPGTSQVRRRQKTSEQNRASPGGAAKDVFLGQKLNIFSLPQDMVLMIVEFLDVESALSFLRTSKVRL